MRRKIELWIDGQLADLSDQSLVLWNYSLTDLQKPTAVKNSYSKQVTLPGTPANAKIFGHLSRPDRTADEGFNPLERTPFAIYDEMGQILESGYLKLDSVTRRHSVVTGYKVSLYGGLGSFFYGLMYDDDGEKRKLYDMSYYAYNKAVDMSVTMTRNNIQTSWLRIDDYRPSSAARARYRALNFLPCYNGIPQDEFDADKVIVKPSTAGEGAGTSGSVGIPLTLTDEDGSTVSPYNGYGLITLSEKMNEWEMRDLRSYLQRPILNIKAFLDSLSMSANNGGWSLDWKTRPYQEEDLWMTLKPLSTIDYASEETQNIEVSMPIERLKANKGVHTQTIEIVGGEKGISTLNIGVSLRLYDDTVYAAYFDRYCAFDRYRSTTGLHDTACNAMMLQAVGYDGSGNAVAHSDLVIMTNATEQYPDVQDVARIAFEDGLTKSYNGFTPVGVTAYGTGTVFSEGYFQQEGTSYWYKNWSEGALALSLSGPKITKVVVTCAWVAEEDVPYTSDEEAIGMWHSAKMNNYASQTGTNPFLSPAAISGTNTIAISAVRSGVTLSAEQLLNTDHSICDYLLSLAKIYGWIFTADQATKTITVWDRNSFFSSGEGTIDLSSRIDRSKDITITPLYAESPRYKFELTPWGSAFASRYETLYSRKYGDKVINTGYHFAASDINLADGIVFKPAVEVVKRGRRYGWIYKTTIANWQYGWEAVPRTITYGGIGEAAYSQDYPAIYPDGHNGFSNDLSFADSEDRFEFCDAEGKQLDGDGVLVYMRPRENWGWNNNGQWYQLTDDFDEMYYLNEGKPCWICDFDDNSGHTINVAATDIPAFGFYAALYDSEGDEWTYGDNLLFGLPAELNDPYVSHYSEGKCWYHKYWRNYLTDLLDKDTKVMRCRVDLSGLQVGPELLRRFFWYENSIWVLNKITSYSLTTWDPAECEFVRVRNAENYTNGQILD